MFLEKKLIPKAIPEPITAPIAQEIYNAIKEHGSLSKAYSELSKYDWVYFEDVHNEVEALEAICREELARPTEQPAPYEDTDKGETIQETIDLRPTSRADLLSRIESEILDVDLFLSDFMDYVLTYIEGTTWDDFISQYNQNDQV